MDTEKMEALAGQVDALSLVVTQLVLALSPQQAAQAASGLAKAGAEPDSASNFSTPEQQAIARKGVLGGYVELLSSIAKRG